MTIYEFITYERFKMAKILLVIDLQKQNFNSAYFFVIFKTNKNQEEHRYEKKKNKNYFPKKNFFQNYTRTWDILKKQQSI